MYGIDAVAITVVAALTWTPGADGGGVLWSRSYTDATYNTSGLLMPAGRLAAGTWLNPPKQVETFEIEGAGEPVWTFPGTDFEVATSHRADVLAAVDREELTTLRVYKWTAGSAVPDWSFPIESATPGTHRAVAVSRDGSTIAVVVTRQAAQNNGRLYLFDASSSVPLATWDAPVGTFARNLSLTDDGGLVALMFGAMVYVYDRDAGGLRYEISAGASNDALVISGDGRLLAYGWTSMFVREWDGATYDLRWAKVGAGYWLRHCAASSDGRTLVAGWSRPTSDQNKVDLHDAASSTPIWSYEYDLGSGDYQDAIDDLAVTADGGHIAAASWGDRPNTNPELHVFARTSSEPMFTLDTPGSMFDVDIARGSGGRIFVSTCGKGVHANQQGRGGDLYAVALAIDCPADIDGNGTVDFGDILLVLTAWGPCGGCPEDIDDSGSADFGDILAVLTDWGACP